jgi:hypothetical protein
MPDLDISKKWTDSFWMYAAMAYPKDERRRNEFVAAIIVTRVMLELEDSAEDIEIPNSVFRVLLNAPGYEDVTKRAYKVADKGSVAGDLLDYIAQMYCVKHKNQALEKLFMWLKNICLMP